jgi:predicted dinucleotide-binding enzyme
VRHSREFGGSTPTVFLAGDDPDAKATVAELVADLGCEPVDAGALATARFLEPLAALMATLDRASDGVAHALKLLRRRRVGAAHGERVPARTLAGPSVERPPT